MHNCLWMSVWMSKWLTRDRKCSCMCIYVAWISNVLKRCVNSFFFKLNVRDYVSTCSDLLPRRTKISFLRRRSMDVLSNIWIQNHRSLIFVYCEVSKLNFSFFLFWMGFLVIFEFFKLASNFWKIGDQSQSDSKYHYVQSNHQSIMQYATRRRCNYSCE